MKDWNWYDWACWATVILIVIVGMAIVSHAQGPTYPYSVVSSWTLSISPNITGQNIYRAPYANSTCGTFAKLNTTPLSPTTQTYTDQSPPEGAYCYGVTATDANSESGLSNVQSNINIPPPPPTKFGVTIAKLGTQYDVIYAWINPTGLLVGNSVYCGAKAIQVFFPTNKVRVTTPAGTNTCAVTATGLTGESGLSNQVKVVVP